MPRWRVRQDLISAALVAYTAYYLDHSSTVLCPCRESRDGNGLRSHWRPSCYFPPYIFPSCYSTPYIFPTVCLARAGGMLRVADVEQRTAAVWECVQQIEDSRKQDGQQVILLVTDWCYPYVSAQQSCAPVDDSHILLVAAAGKSQRWKKQRGLWVQSKPDIHRFLRWSGSWCRTPSHRDRPQRRATGTS